MDLTSEYFSQRFDKPSSNKLSTKRKPGKSKGNKSSSNSNQSKRRSSLSEFFRASSSSKKINLPKESALKTATSTSTISSDECSRDSSSFQSSDQQPETKHDVNIYLEDTLILPKSHPKNPFEPNSNIYLDETISCFQEASTAPSSKKVEKPKKSEPASSNDTLEDVRWKRLNELKRCPICLKKFEKLVPHIKSCATKQSISTDQLFKAIDLQLKQNEERAALGFLSSQTVRPTTRRTTSASKGSKDASLELALALSISLQESKMKNIMKESEALMEMGFEAEALEQRKVLEQFSLPEAVVQIAPKSSKFVSGEKKKLQSKLFTRSKEDQERILADKVANILMSNDSPVDLGLESPENVKSKIQSKFKAKSKNLWQLSTEEIESSDLFYVPNLSDSIAPSSGNIYERLKSKAPIQESDSPIKSDAYLEEIFKPAFSKSSDATSAIIQSSSVKSKNTFTSHSECIKVGNKQNSKPSRMQSTQASSLQDLSTSWRHLLRNKTFSDVKILTKEEKEIPAHRLVFFARCPGVLDDLISETDPRTNSQTHLLAWNDFTTTCIDLFLEFLYCATVDFSKLDDGVKTELCSLAERYEDSALIRYLHDTECFGEESPSFPSVYAGEALNKQQITKSLYFESPVSNQTKPKMQLNPFVSAQSKSPRNISRPECKQIPASSESAQNNNKSSDKLNRSLSPDIFGAEEAPSQNTSFLESHPENLLRLVESIQSLSKQGDEETIDNIVSHASEKKGTKDTDSEFDIKAIDSLEEEPFKLSDDKNTKSSQGTEIEIISPVKSASQEMRDTVTEKHYSQENTDSTCFDNKENSAPFELPHLSDEDTTSSNGFTSRKRKSSISDHGDKSKKSCLEDKKIVSVDLTLESSASTVGTLQLDSLSNPNSPPILDNIGHEEECNKSDLNCSDSTVILPGNERRGSSSPGLRSEAEVHSLPPSPAGNNSGSKEETQANYGYISPFWEAFDEGYGVFTAAEDSPPKSPLECRKESSNDRHSPKTASQDKIVVSSGSTSNKNSQDVIPLSPEDHLNLSATSVSPLNNSRRSCSSPFNQSVRLKSKSPSPVKLSAKVVDRSASPKKRRQQSENFANDSLFENESLLNQIECNIQQAPGTSNAPCQTIRQEVMRTPSPQLIHSNKVTPMLDYSGMKTIEIKNELSKYGLKPSLGKKKGKVLLRYIYSELHPTIEALSGTENKEMKEGATKDQPPTSSANHVGDSDSESEESNGENQFECSFSSEASTLPEESIDTMPESLTQTVKSKFLKEGELEKPVLEFIRADKQLHTKVLMYEPLWLEKFFDNLKGHGIKCKLSDLMDVLDKKCITFRTLSSYKRNAKQNGKNKRVKSTLSQPVKSPKKGRKRTKISEEVTYASD
ncbi:unnamed protein product [Bemisia tabaci]|uniref:Structure-specific endonuclease subunit SLX4 n=1 Tax=Bemisia tabaci TaxID=7038 RepID=A0AAI8Y5W0_BEMTA|nr:unnamed protein product [Bemisia tabaci]